MPAMYRLSGMEPIRVVWGTGTGPTGLAARDAALAAANVHQYNLSTLSSVIPADASIESVGTAPDLGPVGGRLDAVAAVATAAEGPASAVLAWTRRSDGAGVFYESAGTAPVETVRRRALEGIRAGTALREGTYGDVVTQAVTVDESEAPYVAAAVLAVYGSAERLL